MNRFPSRERCVGGNEFPLLWVSTGFSRVEYLVDRRTRKLVTKESMAGADWAPDQLAIFLTNTCNEKNSLLQSTKAFYFAAPDVCRSYRYKL